MNLPKRTLTAIEAVVFIACKSGATPIRSNEIAQYQNIAKRYLEPIMQALVKAKILRGVRGPKGGYLLAKERRKIMLSDIVAAMRVLENSKANKQSKLRNKVIDPICKDAVKDTLQQFHAISIQDVCDKAKTAGVIAAGNKSDFTI